jgi:hypothetical protein
MQRHQGRRAGNRPRSANARHLDIGTRRPRLDGPAVSDFDAPAMLGQNPRYGTQPPALMRPTHRSDKSPSHSLSLVLGSRRSETGLCEIDSGELLEVRRGHGTRPDRDNCFLLV